MSSSAQPPPRAAEESPPTGRPDIALAIIVSCQLMLIVDASILAPRFVAEPERHPGRIDVSGALTSTLGMGALAYAFIRVGDTGWSDDRALGAFAAAAVLIAIFLVRQSRGTLFCVGALVLAIVVIQTEHSHPGDQKMPE